MIRASQGQSGEWKAPQLDYDIRYSLILATVGRTKELSIFLAHLATQSYPHFELVVVDQNQDNRLIDMLADYSAKFSIRHCKSAIGLSRARNVGLSHIDGNVIAFPDDDCWYEPDLLERVARIFATQPEIDGITGRPVDKTFHRFHTSSGPINKENVFLRSSSFTIFLRRRVVESVGTFDEGLGLGSPTGRIAAEESDYLIRAIERGFQLYLNADLRVFHAEPLALYDAKYNRKARGYNIALGFVLRKHRYPFAYVAKTWVRSAGGMIMSAASINWPRMQYHYNVLIGRITGYFAKP